MFMIFDCFVVICFFYYYKYLIIKRVLNMFIIIVWIFGVFLVMIFFVGVNNWGLGVFCMFYDLFFY